MQLCDSHDEENVYSELIVLSPKLKYCGGFELMRCQSNCRDLMLVDTRWSVEKLKEAVGQSKIYIRPVQKSLSTEPLERSSQSKSDLKEICVECNCLINLSELRNHSEECFGTTEIPVNDFGDVEAEIQSDTQAQDAPPTISWDSNITEEQPSNANTQAPHVHVPGAILSESNMTEEQPNADTQAPHVPPAVLSETNITAELHECFPD